MGRRFRPVGLRFRPVGLRFRPVGLCFRLQVLWSPVFVKLTFVAHGTKDLLA